MAEKARIAILISGRGSNMAAMVYAAKSSDCPYEIKLVASNDPDAPGLRLAEAEGIATFAHPHKGLTRETHDGIMHDAIVASGAEYVVLAGYMRILSDGFVRKWTDHMLNIHPSLLPKYKGLDTYQRAIDAGDRVAGCSVHLVTAELDDGPVLAQTEVAILPDDDADSLASRILNINSIRPRWPNMSRARPTRTGSWRRFASVRWRSRKPTSGPVSVPPAGGWGAKRRENISPISRRAIMERPVSPCSSRRLAWTNSLR
jgi:formyltetrahydrofolate-dependent phosphoribosylglycinamide formyltransferase